ncbi:hypothetical protein EDD21DRAFT_160484 [Dissophora ornata]|nr:hypothetical protein EDD21DRAFT_160484 [Dissophora ornata]
MKLCCRFALLAIVLFCISVSYVQACEDACRGDPVKYLVEKYEAVLLQQANTLSNPQFSNIAKRLIPRVTSQLQGRGHAIDKAIFSNFRGPCANQPGERGPDEFCGSAKSIACFAAWGHRRSVFDSVHAAVVNTVSRTYDRQSPEIRAAMIDGVGDFCLENC